MGASAQFGPDTASASVRVIAARWQSGHAAGVAAADDTLVVQCSACHDKPGPTVACYARGTGAGAVPGVEITAGASADGPSVQEGAVRQSGPNATIAGSAAARGPVEPAAAADEGGAVVEVAIDQGDARASGRVASGTAGAAARETTTGRTRDLQRPTEERQTGAPEVAGRHDCGQRKSANIDGQRLGGLRERSRIGDRDVGRERDRRTRIPIGVRAEDGLAQLGLGGHLITCRQGGRHRCHREDQGACCAHHPLVKAAALSRTGRYFRGNDPGLTGVAPHQPVHFVHVLRLSVVGGG